jgi:3-dehydroquinate synthase
MTPTLPTRIAVGGAGERLYEVVVGRGLLDEVAPLLGSALRVALVHPAALAQGAAWLAERLTAAGLRVTTVEIPDGEDAKQLSVAATVWDRLGAEGFTRTDACVAYGGGATTDLAGFVAATWLRGVPVVHVPTTVLGMVDAAVGGKTGIDTAAGKNLVGAFHPPAGVVCDLDLLATLPQPEYASGLAEVVKAGFVDDPEILELVEADPAAVLRSESPVTRELVERAVRFKARVVSADLREAGLREILNYGHTLGHAVEAAEGYRWRHGEAVAVGMVFAAELGHLVAGLDRATVERHRAVLSSVGLPVRYDGTSTWETLLGLMRVDKKARGDQLRFVVLDALGSPRTVDGPDPAALAAAYAKVTT